MKTLMRFTLLLTLLVGRALPVAAQTYNASTTLSQAVTSYTATTITVASVTGMAVGNFVYVAGGNELMQITAINTTTKILTVTRSTRPALHPTSSVVFWGPATMFVNGAVDGQGHPLYGSCTATNYPYLPLIDRVTGNVYLCRAFGTSAPNTTAQWTWTNAQLQTPNSLLKNLQ